MAAFCKGLMLLAAVGCTLQSPWHILQNPPAPGIPFRPETAWQWPLWPTRDGWLVGGSGYVTGLAGPMGVAPGLGLGGVLIPSRRTGTLFGFAGPLPTPPPVTAPPMVWHDPKALPSPSPPSKNLVLSKIGPLPVIDPLHLPLPPKPYLATAWGPVALETGPLPRQSAAIPLGFPPADGTPVAMTGFIPWFQLHDGLFDVILLDRTSRKLFRPPPLRNLPGSMTIGYYPPVLLIGPILQSGRLSVFDLVTGSLDPLPELPEVLPLLTIGGTTLSQRGEVIVFQTQDDDSPRIHAFDRRSRFVDRLAHINEALPDPRQPSIDFTGTKIAFSFLEGRDRDIALYDLPTAQLLPMPEINTGANQTNPSLSANGGIVTYLTDEAGVPQARLYDRRLEMLDDLPEINSLGAILACAVAPDGFELFVVYQAHGQIRIAVYDRRTGFIDDLPELNLPGTNLLP